MCLCVKVQNEEAPCSKHVPIQTKDLYVQTIQGPTLGQCNEVAKLLIKHKAFFSESDADLGSTGILKHKIPTGDAR